jgi:hypothetical protein
MVEKINHGKNAMLVRDEVGKGKPFTHAIPHDEHAYGKPNIKDEHGAGSMLGGWNGNQRKTKKLEVNYLKLNGMAAKKGVNAQTALEFRKNNGDKVRRAQNT